MRFCVACAQIKPKKADYLHNLGKVGDVLEQAADLSDRPGVLVLPETVMTGYFLEGGVREGAVTAHRLAADLHAIYSERLGGAAPPIDCLVGFYEDVNGELYNSSLYVQFSSDGPEIKHVHRKFFLPTYGVFDEDRFVASGDSVGVFETRFGRAAMLICEDAWHSISGTLAALQGAQVIYVLSASPARGFGGEQIGSLCRWERMLSGMAEEHGVFVVYCGLVGFEGGKGFTGTSRIIDPFGTTKVTGSSLEECLITAEINLDDVNVARAASPLLSDLRSKLPIVTSTLQAAKAD